MNIEIGYAPKTVKVDDTRYLHFWYANNKGRGGTNCTICLSTDPRADVSAKQTGVIACTRTGSWGGNVNFSRRVMAELGL